MVESHIYGNSVTINPESGHPLNSRRRRGINFDIRALYDLLISSGVTDPIALSAGLLVLSGESRLVDCTVHHNRVVVDDKQRGGDIQDARELWVGPNRIYMLGAGAVFKGGIHRMQRCSVYENAAPDPDVANAHFLFSAGGIAIAWATVEMEQGIISGNFGRGGGAAIRTAGALRLIGALVSNNSGSLGFVGGSAGGVFLDGGALAVVNVTWAGNRVRDLVKWTPLPDVLALRKNESASHLWIRAPFTPTFEQRTEHGFQYQLEARGCRFQQGALKVKGAMLILGSEIRDATVTIDGEGEMEFGSCAFHNATVASTMQPGDKSRIIVRNTQFLDRSKVLPAVVGCDPGGSQSFKTGTGAYCDRRARCEDAGDDSAIVAGIRCTCAVPGSDQSDVSEFKDGTRCDQQSSARVYAESQVVNFVLQKPLRKAVVFSVRTG
jgi:hypothetical protein